MSITDRKVRIVDAQSPLTNLKLYKFKNFIRKGSNRLSEFLSIKI